MVLPFVVACLLGGSQLALGAAVRPRGVTPKNPHDQKTTEHCTWWLDYDKAMSCDELLEENLITIKQFQRWNPSITGNCNGMAIGKAYCVEAAFEPDQEPEPEPEPEPKPTNKPEPSPTKPSNGIETPADIQLGMVSNCDKFYLVEQGDSCASIASEHGITLAQFTTWNSKVGTNCGGLWADAYACVSIIGQEPKPTSTTAKVTPTNGIETPSPLQKGVANSCNKFHMVKTTTTCNSIESYYNLPLSDFYKWNPAVGDDCRSLLAGYWVCVSVIGWKPPSPTQPDKGNGTPTPSPVQVGVAKNCNKFYQVKTTTTCSSIESYFNVPLSDFYKWNPAVGTDCRSLLAGYHVCISVDGWKPPTPTKPDEGNGIATPSPIQSGMTKSCNKFYEVKTTTTCSSIRDYFTVNLADFYKWNPAVGSNCGALWPGYNVCIGVIGQKPTPTQPPTKDPTPSPIQPGTVKNCKKFHLVKDTTTCASIQDYYKITMANLYKWNPAIGSKCTSLWAKYYVCVSA
ncbi:hypothetical protein F66182_4844 [Fusarium sp. NRRL 66182]|nr:hypothetical protein F66182_4844 [Fusarium sp. NRRL 66182]